MYKTLYPSPLGSEPPFAKNAPITAGTWRSYLVRRHGRSNPRRMPGHAAIDQWRLHRTRHGARRIDPAGSIHGTPMLTSNEDLFASLRELKPLILAHQASADRQRCMPAAVM